MPTLSFEGGVDASYAVAAGQPTVTVRSKSRLNHRAVLVGQGQMLFHWVQEGKTQAWRCDMSMAGARQADFKETKDGDGDQVLEVALGDVYPAGMLLRGRLEGTLQAPAVHIEVPWWRDVWVFLVRSPWFQAKLQLDRASLAVRRGSGAVTATLEPAEGRGSPARTTSTEPSSRAPL